MDDLPEPVANRLRRVRGRVGPDAVELEAGASLDELGKPAAVLVIGWVADGFEQAVSWFDALRRTLDGSATVAVLAPVVEDVIAEPGGLRSRLRRRPEATYRPRHIVGALREAGWTVADIERFEVDGVSTWADIVAKDLGADGRSDAT